jgi:drug/metabolite transporter (DMT)-like permease
VRIQAANQDEQAECGVHLALFSLMAVWGLNLSAVKALTQTLDVVLVGALRMFLAAAILGAFVIGQGFKLPNWKRSEWGIALLAAFFLVYFNQIAFAEGLSKTSATNAALVMALGPTVALLVETIAFGRAVTPRQFLGIGAAFTGVAAVVLARPGAALKAAAAGDLWILLSVISFAVGGACVQRLTRRASPLFVGFMAHVLGACMLAVDVAMRVPDPLPEVAVMGMRQWSLVFFSGVLATGLGALIWARGISALGVGRTTSYLSWVPIFGVGFGALLFAETLTRWHGFGLMAVMWGSLLIAREKRQPTPA